MKQYEAIALPIYGPWDLEKFRARRAKYKKKFRGAREKTGNMSKYVGIMIVNCDFYVTCARRAAIFSLIKEILADDTELDPHRVRGAELYSASNRPEPVTF